MEECPATGILVLTKHLKLHATNYPSAYRQTLLDNALSDLEMASDLRSMGLCALASVVIDMAEQEILEAARLT
jgi:hypothetical protein